MATSSTANKPAEAGSNSANKSSGFDSWFEITKRGSSVGREIRGGLVTFFTMAYIIVLNPFIIGTTADIEGNLISGLPASDPANIDGSIAMVAAATALVAGVLTILMGVYGRFPIALAAGLGINSVVAFTIASKMTWPQAMGMVFWEGVLITILVLTGFRKAVLKAVPKSLRSAISVGIGLFIAFVGLADAHFVTAGAGTPVQLGGNGTLSGWPILVFIIGLFIVIGLYVLKVKGAMLIGIAAATVIGIIFEAVLKISAFQDSPTWALNVPGFQGWSAPDLGLIGRVDLFGAFNGAGFGTILGFVLLIFALLLADFFDTMGTVVAVGAEGGLLREDGNPDHIQEILLVDSLAAVAGGLGSTSSNTSYIESASGVGDGARTGVASLVTGLAFLLCLVLAPFVNMVPSEAAAPALVFVGCLMMAQVVEIKWTDLEEAVPAFLCLALMPFAYSISVGIGAGFISYVFIKVLVGKARQIHPLLWVVAIAFIIYFAQGIILGAVAGL